MKVGQGGLRLGKPKQAAGLLMFDITSSGLQILLGHPGGPYYINKDEGYWTLPKGEADPGEDLLEAAKREFKEETGIDPEGPFIPLGFYQAKKINHVWAFRKSYDLSLGVTSNTFHMEWPPGSGKEQEFPEVDRCAWFGVGQAVDKISKNQLIVLARLIEILQDDMEMFISNPNKK